MDSVPLEAQEFWHTICTKAFNNDNDTSDFVLFFEGCKTLNNDQLYEWKSSDSEYQTMLEQLGCNRSKSDLFTLQPDQLSYFLQAKSKIRTDWHAEKQVALKQHLKALLQQESQLPHIDQHQRLSLVRQFVQENAVDVGSVPFLRGLAGLLKFQIRHKAHLVEWNMSEYVLTQNNEETMESYIHLLKDILGLQLVYHDDDSSNDQVVVDMDSTAVNTNEETALTWRMNSDLDHHNIHEILKVIPKHVVAQIDTIHDYRITDIPRNHPMEGKSIFSWIFELFSRCLSLFTR